MSLAVTIAGFTLGAAGSLHCMGMCGPLSMALPVGTFSRSGKFFALLLYQAGRVLTYSLIGLLFGLAGRQLFLAGYQQGFSILLGSIVLLAAFFYFAGKHGTRFRVLDRFYRSVQSVIVRILKSPAGTSRFLLLGMANGLLPCGMVYIALASSLSFSELTDAVGFMAMFGAGTIPAMMLVGYAGLFIRPELRTGFRRMVPVFISLMGVLLILRGLNLGIPFISPELPQSPGDASICHP